MMTSQHSHGLTHFTQFISAIIWCMLSHSFLIRVYWPRVLYEPFYCLNTSLWGRSISPIHIVQSPYGQDASLQDVLHFAAELEFLSSDTGYVISA